MSILQLVKCILYRFRTPLECLPNCPDYFKSYRCYLASGQMTRVEGGWLYKSKFWADSLFIGGGGNILSDIALQYCKGKGIDIGAGFWPLPGSIPIDTEQGPGKTNRLEDIPDSSLDYVFSSHCLEHIRDYEGALREWVRKIKSDGIMFLYLPHIEAAIWLPGSPVVKKSHVWSPTYEITYQALRKLGMHIIAGDPGPDAHWSFYIVGRKRNG